MDTKKIVWQSNLLHTTEMLSIDSADEYRVKSLIIGAVKDVPVQVSYELIIDHNWYITSVAIEVEAEKRFNFFMERNNGKWYDQQGKYYPDLDNATDIDISLTPFTNTLPIKRLKLMEGKTAAITVVYFDLLNDTFIPMKQHYTNMGNYLYKYENIHTGFTSVIQTNEEGLVVDYPGIWQMVYPHD
jgi:hypothetical protein